MTRRFAATAMAVVVSLLSALLAAPGALGAPPRTQAPPGNAGIEQYLEAVPEATGDRPASRGSDGGAGSAVSQRTARQLQSAGPDGEALLDQTQGAPDADAGTTTTTQRTPTSDRRAKRSSSSRDATTTTTTTGAVGAAAGGPPAAGASPAIATSRAVIGEDAGVGLGVLFPVILAALLVLLAVGALVRRRRSA